jgi:DNA-binding response OmpR family regulator
MPEMDGVAVMKAVKKQHPNLIVIILTAHASLDSAITAVKAGASDYLIKPQSINDLETTIQQALSERAPHIHRDQLISFMQESLEKLKVETPIPLSDTKSELSIDLEHHQILIKKDHHQRIVNLTSDQTKILFYLKENYGKVITCREIALNILGYPDLSEKEAENMVRPHILRIRRKIENNPKDPQILRTIRGCGYVLKLEQD